MKRIKRLFPTLPVFIIIVGAIALFFSIQGIVIGSVPFVGRNDVIYSITRLDNEYMFWFVEIFYLISGLLFLIYGIREIKKPK